MAFFQIRNMKIAGVAAGVPRTIASNLDLSAERGEISGDYTPEQLKAL